MTSPSTSESDTASTSASPAALPEEKIGRLGIPYLFRYWQRKNAAGTGPSEVSGDRDLDCTLLAGLNLNVLETARFFNPIKRPSFEAFEDWIIATNGGAMDDAELARLRAALAGNTVGSAIGSLDGVEGLTSEELAFWDDKGYVVVHDAVEPAHRDEAAAAIYDFLHASPTNPNSWYGRKFGVSIWVPLLRHSAFLANRRSPRLIKAFSQLWGREDLWAIVDQGGLNPPERGDWKFPGPHVHWDATIAPPHRFGVQGILYLTDTPAEQGAFSCIPGFHRRLDEWLGMLPAGTDPRVAIRREPGFVPIAGKAGDLIIWHHLLPHGSSPNRGSLPRVAQYIALRSTRWEYTAEWA
ncbi:phytanoyl-CoA dioxygenase family protein [Occallatibacter riparius]|uniref:Phytanoyl-CoA dioxygenase family protein n=1 Tax=Occallatibacter riparius TaxID=1002689 RepID=A0A9J7BTH6_9BACT|nr:phytanoyl-CoA dioxygenase family protein [Occallatibacter riparius]UWZ85897.1 phytanoyl-CoA dioxygenase family protein [Occallatibacter riparius]